MEFQKIIQRALEIRKKYRELEIKKGGKEWQGKELMQGFVGDINDLQVLVDEGGENKEAVAHELSDCLWSVLVLADKYGIDMEKSFLETMNFLDEKINKEIDSVF